MPINIYIYIYIYMYGYTNLSASTRNYHLSPSVVIFFHGFVPEEVVSLYSVGFIHVPGKLDFVHFIAVQSYDVHKMISHAIYGAVCIQLIHFSCDDQDNACTLTYYYQIGSMNHLGRETVFCAARLPVVLLIASAYIEFPWHLVNWSWMMNYLFHKRFCCHFNVITFSTTTILIYQKRLAQHYVCIAVDGKWHLV